MKKYPIHLAIFLILAALLWPGGAHAHRVNIFAWLEGDHVVVECGFNRHSPVRNGEVTVYDDESNKPLLHGRTNDEGRFAFTVPRVVREGHGLRIQVNAGQGHMASWKMGSAELYEAAALTAGFEHSQEVAEKAGLAPQPAPPAPQAAPDTPAISMPDSSAPATPEHVRAIVNEVVESKIAPLRRDMAEHIGGGPSWENIIGGLGWIVGLVGIALFFMGRRK